MADGRWLMSKRGGERILTARAAAVMMIVTMLAWLGAAPGARAQSEDPGHQQFLFAYKLLQRGEERMAADAFDQYLGKFPNAPKRGDATYYRALLYHQSGDNRAASQLLGSHFPEPRLVPGYALDLLRGQVLSDLGKYVKAIAALEKIDTKPLKPTTAASVAYLKGVTYRGAGNPQAAAKALQRAAQVDSPLRARATVDLARVLAQLGEPNKSIKVLKGVIQASGSIAAEAARLAGDLSYQQQQYDQAVKFYGQVLSDHQSSEHFGPSVIGTLWAHYSARQYQTVLDTFSQYLPALAMQDRATAMYLAASANQELGRHEQARQILARITRGGDKFPLLEKSLYKLARSQYALGEYSAMRRTVARLGRLFPKSTFRVDAAFLEATADAKAGEVAKGAARLTALIDQPGNPYHGQALLQRAHLYERHHRLDPAGEDYHRYLDQADWSRPDTRAAALKSIAIDNRRGQPGQARDTAQKLLDLDDLAPARHQEAMYRLGLTQIKLNKLTEALATLNKLQSDAPLNPYHDQATYYVGLIHMSRDQSDQAIPLLSKAADAKTLAKPLQVNALRLMALSQRRHAPAKAQQTLHRIRVLGGLATLTDAEKLFMGRRMLGQNHPRQALTYLQPITRTSGVNATIAQAWYRIGQAQRALKQYDAAADALGRVIAMGKADDLLARLELAQVKADRGNVQGGIEELSGLTGSESSDIAAKALFHSGMLYRRLARQQRRQDQGAEAKKSNNQARQMLKKLVLLYPYPELTPLPQRAYIELAQIAAQQGDNQEAINELEELADKFPGNPYAIYAKAVLAEGQRHKGKAVALLRSIRNKPTLDPELSSWIRAKLRTLSQDAGGGAAAAGAGSGGGAGGAGS